ncbi:hypothetical protein HX091_06325 [Myroides odoratimimus]|uniref:hypothetical protein n=1 Tax=Myroides odoratimimus TaxID=76832 RepID=UPI002578E9B7|nr:hypothetical protein [Myroides odoratimimus]MDM1525565.1 hypothetical protein [Myroides odoratimimus]
MINLQDYLRLSEHVLKKHDIIITSEYLKQNFLHLNEDEQKAILYFTHVTRFSHMFENSPIIYNQIIEYLSNKFKICKTSIVLIGSAKTGFSIDPAKYGNPFSENSDLDFAIIDDSLFEILRKEYQIWKKKYEDGEYDNFQNKKYWPDNINTLKGCLKKGFIDTNKLPSFDDLPTIKSLNNSMSQIVRQLDNIHEIKIKGASVRIYNNWDSFQKRLYINTKSVIEKIT